MKAKKSLMFFGLVFGMSISLVLPSVQASASTSALNPEVDVQSKIDYGYEDYLLQEIIEFEKANPNLSQEEIDAHFLKLAEKYNRNNKDLQIEPKKNTDTPDFQTYANDTNYIYKVVGGECNLNSLEQSLFNANPTKGFKACVAGKEAQDYTLHKFGRNGHNDKTDAFRHSAWNINMIGFTDDVTFTQKWTNAHENGATNQPVMEFNMDMHNNAQGRLKAQKAGVSTSSSVTAVRNVIDQAYKSGDLQYMPSSTQRVNFTGKSSDYVR
ncbi:MULTISPECIES: DUF6973 domain-containing protein [Psychrobacillus]|uniref:DUF6973 domain-containing protein n=1 Tax=Psychrobacillus faecigallinarum TaxID=2762235 RepID=A0ABR8RA70_9BACI|nr:hypothetical protein [Psychrobacillus faecigallinarum]MBD7944694.1 hypothetical protein [Psychrobacillus faecigallinarum]